MSFFHSFDEFDHLEENLIAIMKQATYIENMLISNSGVPFCEKKLTVSLALIANHLKNITLVHRVSNFEHTMVMLLETFQIRMSEFFVLAKKKMTDSNYIHDEFFYNNLLNQFHEIQNHLPDYIHENYKYLL